MSPVGQVAVVGAASGTAYAIAKRADHLRVRGAAIGWGERQARVNSISPGIILTPLAKDEMSGPGAEGYQRMIRESAAGRVDTTDEMRTQPHCCSMPVPSPGATFIDGGVIAAVHAGRIRIGLS